MPIVDPGPDPIKPRWRVVLVRLPAGGVAALNPVLPRDRSFDASNLPLVVRVVDDEEAAQATARRLRMAGAAVACLEESSLPELSAYCPEHPTGLAAERCRSCRRPICPSCVVRARGKLQCATCFHRAESRRRLHRLRQLFAIFLFAVFLYEVVGFLREDAEEVRPDGVVKVGVFQFVPPGADRNGIIATLNAASGPGTHSLRDIAPWFASERERFTGQPGPYLQVSVRGPWTATVRAPPLARPDDAWWRLPLRAWSYVRYFHGLTEDRGVDPGDYAVRVYLVYGEPTDDLAADSRGSERGRVAIAYISLDEANPAYAQVTVAHELAHTLGAIDLYDEATGLSRFPEGYVEPFATPLYPQRFAELMAVDRPISGDAEAEVRSLDEVRVSYRTAADLRWIGAEAAEWFYDPPSLAAQQRLYPEALETSPAEAAPEEQGAPPLDTAAAPGG